MNLSDSFIVYYFFALVIVNSKLSLHLVNELNKRKRIIN
nr:MAG TPA: hypothetical protein [Caudoviricetes sp.]DAU40086.1 MAG TPA: hypothetical protein [Caudoviricetes sp.]